MSEGHVIEDLFPDETVTLEMPGVEDGPQWWDNILVLLEVAMSWSGTGTGTGKTGYVVHVGVIDHDLVIAEMKELGFPPNVRRISIYKVKVERFKQGLSSDELLLDLGEPKNFRLQVETKWRDLTLQLVGLLGGDAAV